MPPTYEDFTKDNQAPGSSPSKSFTALEPQGFLLMLSSCIWKRNLQHLERKIDWLSFQLLPKAKEMEHMNIINNTLYDCRKDLRTLVSQVEHARTHMPPHLSAFFENFPRIRQRQHAAHLSPADHLPELLDRANRLDRLILNNFKILMSSVSVHEGHEGMRKASLATWATVVAAVYLPLTLVTRIFGMNIKGEDGFSSSSTIGAFVGVLLLTIFLGLFATWLYRPGFAWDLALSVMQDSWRKWRKARKVPDVEALERKSH
jgi:Mg2+ and Co2+ transporter CorA